MVWSVPNPLGRYLVQPVPATCLFCGAAGPSDVCYECADMLRTMQEVDR